MNREQFLLRSGGFPEFEEVQTRVGPARVKVMTAGEKDAFDMGVTEKRFGFRAGIVAFTVIDDTGSRIFRDEDIPILNNLPMPDLEPIVDAAIRINRFSKKDQDEAAKN